MELKTERNGAVTTMRMVGGLTVECAAELKNLILNAAGDSEEIVVDLQSLIDMDLSCIQLLCSANLMFEKRRKRFVRTRVQTEVIPYALSEAGYAGEMGCHGKRCKKCFWKGEQG